VKLKLVDLSWVLLCCGLALGAGCDRPTSGARIPVYEHPQIALVVLDLQHEVLRSGGSGMVAEREVEPMLAAVARLVTGARAGGVAVVFVRTEPHGDLDPRLAIGSEPVFVKQRRDAFSSREVEEFLRARSVDHLVLAGALADESVSFTSAGARNRGYKVQVVADAIGAASDARRERAVDRLREAGVEIIDTERVLAEWDRRKHDLGR
jgi:nicotinamidase-related amidase